MGALHVALPSAVAIDLPEERANSMPPTSSRNDRSVGQSVDPTRGVETGCGHTVLVR